METLLKNKQAIEFQISKTNNPDENNQKIAFAKKLSSEITTVNNHEDITKLRLMDFFAELTDLVHIDNLYRGIL